MFKHARPITEETLNNRIKDYTLDEIRNGLRPLLEKGVIAVSNKRFWVRDRPACLDIINGKKVDAS